MNQTRVLSEKNAWGEKSEKNEWGEKEPRYTTLLPGFHRQQAKSQGFSKTGHETRAFAHPGSHSDEKKLTSWYKNAAFKGEGFVKGAGKSVGTSSKDKEQGGWWDRNRSENWSSTQGENKIKEMKKRKEAFEEKLMMKLRKLLENRTTFLQASAFADQSYDRKNNPSRFRMTSRIFAMLMKFVLNEAQPEKCVSSDAPDDSDTREAIIQHYDRVCNKNIHTSSALIRAFGALGNWDLVEKIFWESHAGCVSTVEDSKYKEVLYQAVFETCYRKECPKPLMQSVLRHIHQTKEVVLKVPKNTIQLLPIEECKYLFGVDDVNKNKWEVGWLPNYEEHVSRPDDAGNQGQWKVKRDNDGKGEADPKISAEEEKEKVRSDDIVDLRTFQPCSSNAADERYAALADPCSKVFESVNDAGEVLVAPVVVIDYGLPPGLEPIAMCSWDRCIKKASGILCEHLGSYRRHVCEEHDKTSICLICDRHAANHNVPTPTTASGVGKEGENRDEETTPSAACGGKEGFSAEPRSPHKAGHSDNDDGEPVHSMPAPRRSYVNGDEREDVNGDEREDVNGDDREDVNGDEREDVNGDEREEREHGTGPPSSWNVAHPHLPSQQPLLPEARGSPDASTQPAVLSEFLGNQAVDDARADDEIISSCSSSSDDSMDGVPDQQQHELGAFNPVDDGFSRRERMWTYGPVKLVERDDDDDGSPSNAGMMLDMVPHSVIDPATITPSSSSLRDGPMRMVRSPRSRTHRCLPQGWRRWPDVHIQLLSPHDTGYVIAATNFPRTTQQRDSGAPGYEEGVGKAAADAADAGVGVEQGAFSVQWERELLHMEDLLELGQRPTMRVKRDDDPSSHGAPQSRRRCPAIRLRLPYRVKRFDCEMDERPAAAVAVPCVEHGGGSSNATLCGVSDEAPLLTCAGERDHPHIRLTRSIDKPRRVSWGIAEYYCFRVRRWDPKYELELIELINWRLFVARANKVWKVYRHLIRRGSVPSALVSGIKGSARKRWGVDDWYDRDAVGGPLVLPFPMKQISRGSRTPWTREGKAVWSCREWDDVDESEHEYLCYKYQYDYVYRDWAKKVFAGWACTPPNGRWKYFEPEEREPEREPTTIHDHDDNDDDAQMVADMEEEAVRIWWHMGYRMTDSKAPPFVHPNEDNAEEEWDHECEPDSDVEDELLGDDGIQGPYVVAFVPDQYYELDWQVEYDDDDDDDDDDGNGDDADGNGGDDDYYYDDEEGDDEDTVGMVSTTHEVDSGTEDDGGEFTSPGEDSMD